MEYTVGSLYAGVGGICKGFINAGAKVSWANEFDHKACITYRANFSHTLYEGDVWQLDPTTLEKVDILVGGFPCQPFSIAGYRKGFEDERGNHFFRILQFIKGLNYPKAIFLENVKNLKTHDHGNTFKVIKESLEALGYSFDCAVLNSKDYGNIPQNRERIYIVCFKNESDGTNKYSRNFKFPKPIKLTKKTTDLISKSSVDEKYYYRENKKMYESIVNEITDPNTIYQWRRHYVRENKKNVCPTLTANMGTGGHNVPLIFTKNGIRKLTPKECFLFQGFPENYILPSEENDASLYKQAGNSVTVTVIERIAQNIIKALNDEKCDGISIDDEKQLSLNL